MLRTVAIVGSRGWSDRAAVAAAVRELPGDTTVISGGAAGADRMAAEEARRHGLTVRELRADWSRGRAAGPERNTELVAQADAVIAFWDGRSRGTADTIAKARRAGKPVRVVTPAQQSAPQQALALD